MGARDHVPVGMTAKGAAAAASFIRTRMIPAVRERADTILTPGEANRHVRQLAHLAALLSRSAGMKRNRDVFRKQLPRELIEAFARGAAGMVPPGVDARLLGVPLYQEMREALNRKRGRPRMPHSERMRRLDPKFATHERNRWKAARELRLEAEHAEYLEELVTSGRTILTL